MPLPRLRQLVLVAPEVEAVSQQLSALLGTPPYRDPGVAEFGLANAVHQVGDAFVEVVAPTRPGTAAGRQLHRQGPSGYMAMAEVDDLDAARSRLDRLGVRVVWSIELPDVVDLHLHPKDVPGAILALDRVDPPGSWRWGGPDWRPAPGGIVSLTIAVDDPEAACQRWAEVLGVQPAGTRLELDWQDVCFTQAQARHGIVAATLALARPSDAPPIATVAGVALALEDA